MTTLDPWPLNTTKLHPPRVTANLVVRPRLFKQLEQGVLGSLTLVCASAGYGKTTLVSSWLVSSAPVRSSNDISLPAAWLSLDEYDSDLTVFVRYFCAALRTIFPSACAQTLALLSAPQPAPLNILVATLSSEVAGLPRDFIFVLDDYHQVSGVEVPDLLFGLARHWPQPLHLVLLTRHNPALPLARLRASNELTEIRSRDLQFTTGEIAQYLAAVLGRPPSEAALAQLERQTEGWIVALRLSTLSLPDNLDASALAASAGTDTNIAEYLVDELLSRQPPDVMAFLLKTALLDRFCLSLCEEVIDAIGDDRDARACLEWLQHTDFLVIALDDRREWYRYHHLVQDLLQVRAAAALGSDQVMGLQRRAAAWFAQQGLIEEALQQALAGSDFEMCARLMQQALCTVLNHEDAATLRRWLGMLPEDFRRRRLGLLMLEAWTLHFSFRIGELPALLLRVETLVAGETETLAADEAQLLRAQSLALRAQLAYMSNQAVRGIAYAQEALAILPPSCKFLRGLCMFYLGLSEQASGQGDAIERTLWLHYEAASDKSDAYASRILGTICFSELQAGLLEKARQSGTLLLEQARRGAMVVVEGWAHSWLGQVYYEWNELAAAAQHFQAVIRQRHSLHSFPAREGLLGMLRVQIAAGDADAARQTLDLLSQYDVDILGHETAATLSARAEFQYLQGDLVDAGRWVDSFNEPVPDQPLHSLQDPHVAKARLLLARGAGADVQAAQALIAALYSIAERTCNTRSMIVLAALRALALDAEGQDRAAQVSLQEAIELAQPGGFIRTFADLGPRLHELLHRLSRHSSAPEFIHRIVGTFPVLAKDGMPPSRSHLPLSPSLARCNPLTARELDVLILLRERLSAKEIARQLGISIVTVNRHSANLYRKLDVNTRWDAVAKAEALDILSPH
ncbi:MAG: LuxR C-terminal-related transcriptional regulator [Caldilineaceae bacterium]